MPPNTHPDHDGPAQSRGESDRHVVLFGIHAVEAALRNRQRRLHRLLVTENAERRLAAALAARPVAVVRTTPRDLARLLGPDAVHQGALLEAEPLADVTLEDLARRAGRGPLVALDQVTDPQNVGAVLRSAAVFGAAGVILTRRHSPPLSGALAKSASGALDLVPVVLVGNLARALADLGSMGIIRIGLDSAAPELIERESFAGAVALVFGAEGKGLRQLTRETCDRLCRIATPGPLSSLNVSNAAAVALHLCAMRRSGL